MELLGVTEGGFAAWALSGKPLGVCMLDVVIAGVVVDVFSKFRNYKGRIKMQVGSSANYCTILWYYHGRCAVGSLVR